MRRFKFKFATVLHLRKTREDEALRALGAAQREHQQKLAEKEELVLALENSLKRREVLGNQPIDILPFQLESEFIQGQKQRIVRADREIVRAMRGVEKALRYYLNCKRQTKMIETIEEKHLAEFKKDKNKREQKDLDDLMVMRDQLNSERKEQSA